MSIYSKVYSVKSNAARAAKPHGLIRADLEACEGGWRFAMPNIADELPEPVVVGAPAEPAIETPTEPEPAPETPAETVPEKEPWIYVTETLQTSDEVSSAIAMMAARREIGVRKGRPGRRRKENGIGAKVIGELRTNWTTIDDLVEMTGWEPHTTRAYISVQSRKLGLQAERRRVEGVTSYRIL